MKSPKTTKPLEYLPVQRKVYLSGNASPASQTGLIDCGRIASTANHRLYRYGKKYQVKIDADIGAFGVGDSIEVWSLADSWAVQRAFAEAKAVFDLAYENERENLSKSAQARWFDFRATAGVSGDTMYATVANDPTGAASLLTGGEFVTSVVEDQAGVSRTFSWRTATIATQYSIPAEYDLSGNTNVSPSSNTGSGPYADLQADSSAIEMLALQNRGDSPPYDATAFPGVWVKIATLQMSNAEGAQKLSTGYFDAPCGQVVLKMGGAASTTSINNKVAIEFRAGDYKGVRAHNMERV
jgi:hypothetical protein